MNKIFNLVKNKYVTYGLVIFIYLLGVVSANVLDALLVDAGECFAVGWNILAAWGIIRYYQKKWLIRLNKTRFFNLYMLLGLLVIAINFLRYLGPTDFHSGAHLYIVAFIVSFGSFFAEETLLRALTIEVFEEENRHIKWYKIVIAVVLFAAFSFFKNFLSSYFVNLITNSGNVDSLLTQSVFWQPILDGVILSAAFGFFLFAIYRKTNLSTCVIISVSYNLLKQVTLLSVSATYLPDNVTNILMVINLAIMVISGLFFTLYKKKLPQNLEYEIKEESN